MFEEITHKDSKDNKIETKEMLNKIKIVHNRINKTKIVNNRHNLQQMIINLVKNLKDLNNNNNNNNLHNSKHNNNSLNLIHKYFYLKLTFLKSKIREINLKDHNRILPNKFLVT